jgi:hypothetical protein
MRASEPDGWDLVVPVDDAGKLRAQDFAGEAASEQLPTFFASFD